MNFSGTFISIFKIQLQQIDIALVHGLLINERFIVYRIDFEFEKMKKCISSLFIIA